MMSNKGKYKIDGYMLTALMVTLVATTAVLFVPFNVSKIAGHDGWLALIIVTVSGAYLVYILYRLSTLFPGQTLIEYLPMVVGKAAGKIMGLGYILVLIYITSSVLREALALFYGTGVFTLTPEILIGLFIVIATTYGVSAGIETIARTLSLYWLVLGIIYTVFIFMVIPSMKFEALMPIGEAGWLTILKSSMVPHSFRGQLFLLAMLLPYCRSNREGFIAGTIANIMISIFIIVTVIACVTVMGADFTARSFFGPFVLADFIQPIGIKILLVSVWVVAFWGKITLLQFCLTDGISQLLGLKEHRPIILPIAILLLASSMTFYQNTTDFFEFSNLILPGMTLFFGYLIPSLLFVIALIKTEIQAKSEAPQNSLPSPN